MPTAFSRVQAQSAAWSSHGSLVSRVTEADVFPVVADTINKHVTWKAGATTSGDREHGSPDRLALATTLATMPLTDPDARYVHGVRADDDHWTDAWNFSLGGTRGSIGLLNATESHTAPYDLDLAVLAGPPHDWPPMFYQGSW